jgi:hypothetical protein
VTATDLLREGNCLSQLDCIFRPYPIPFDLRTRMIGHEHIVASVALWSYIGSKDDNTATQGKEGRRNRPRMGRNPVRCVRSLLRGARLVVGLT